MILSYPTTIIMSFGKWLRDVRNKKRMSGAELERRSGVSRQYISNLERELKTERTQQPIQPSIEIVERLAKALRVDLDEARLAAGYAPREQKPITAAEAVNKIAEMLPGFEGLIAFGGMDDTRATEILDDFRRIAELHKRTLENEKPDKNQQHYS